ncbi:transcriptional regulator GutM [Priestia aryabhattai]|uniref:transcriptional regulator GutM n=1 Tax=Priestia aryabhattai TaxID=412384 RepID=UPI00399FAA4A
MWGVFMAIFIVLWLLQFLMTKNQLKHYHQTVKEMSNRSSGYLGIGVDKKRFGIGTVLIIVTDVEGTVVDCRIMSGVTVFAKFKKCKRFNDLDILDTNVLNYEPKYQLSLKMAIEKIHLQMNQMVSVL